VLGSRGDEDVGHMRGGVLRCFDSGRQADRPV
jgi:hypothetical protein